MEERLGSIVDLSGSQPRIRQTLLVGDEPRDIVFAARGDRYPFWTQATHACSSCGMPPG